MGHGAVLPLWFPCDHEIWWLTVPPPTPVSNSPPVHVYCPAPRGSAHPTISRPNSPRPTRLPARRIRDRAGTRCPKFLGFSTASWPEGRLNAAPACATERSGSSQPASQIPGLRGIATVLSGPAACAGQPVGSSWSPAAIYAAESGHAGRSELWRERQTPAPSSDRSYHLWRYVDFWVVPTRKSIGVSPCGEILFAVLPPVERGPAGLGRARSSPHAWPAIES